MKKLFISIIIALLTSSNLSAQPNDVSGKIRFTGQITAPSCEITSSLEQSLKINFTNCQIKKSKTDENIQKLHATVYKRNHIQNDILSVVVVYK